MQLEIKKLGNSAGLILPAELLKRLGLEPGDAVILNETPTGFAVSRGDDVFEEGMKHAREAMKKYHNTLAALAK